jgi:hypothetical protein
VDYNDNEERREEIEEKENPVVPQPSSSPLILVI